MDVEYNLESDQKIFQPILLLLWAQVNFSGFKINFSKFW